MKPLVLAIVALLAAASAARAGVDSASGTPWEIEAGGEVGIPTGWVKVGENDVRGTKLHFRRDLGIDTSESFTLAPTYHLDDDDALRLSVQSLFLDGSTRLDRDAFFNGTTLQGATRLETRTGFPDFLRVGLRYQRRLASLGRGGVLFADAGLDYVMLTFRVKGTLAASSKGSETKEDFLTQELPVPMLGLHGDVPIAGSLFATFLLDGGYLPRVDSLRNEGGDVKVNQAQADADVGVGYELARGLRGEVGYRYSYFFQLEKSREDDNVILLSDHGLALSVSYRF